MSLLRVAYGENDLVHTEDGRVFIDLISSTGAVFLGHANRAVNAHVVAQLDRISCSWTSMMDIQDDCKERVGHHIGDELRLHSLYSSGMEAAEVAMRLAFHETKRAGIIGFRNNNHGKSLATQNISRLDADLPRLDGFHQVPFLPRHSEEESLDHAEKILAGGDIAAVFVEPMQGRGGGYAASHDFYLALEQRCRAHGTLLVCDEIFSGFYRTGPCFRYEATGIRPDVVLVGKAMGNGFPVAGVLLDRRFEYHPKDFRFSSTYADNPLACAAVVGSLAEMERVGVEERVAHIERSFQKLDVPEGATVRLHGAACFVELDTEGAAVAAHDHLFANQVLALRRGKAVGFWPPATITEDNLQRVIDVTNSALVRAT